MKFKDILWFSWKTNKKMRKRLTFLFIFFSIVIVFVCSFNKSINKYLYSGIMREYNYNYYFVSSYNNINQKEIDKLKNINHIEDVFMDDYQSYSVYLKSIAKENTNGSFYIVGSNEKLLSKMFGIDIKLNDNEIICPHNFYPSDDIQDNRFISSNKIINLKHYINNNIDVYYNKYINDNHSIKKDLSLKLVEVYKNNDSTIDENLCYVSRNLIKTVFDDAYENIDLSNQIGSLVIALDNQNNYPTVAETIHNYGYQISSSFTLNDDFMTFINVLSYLIIIFAFVFAMIFISSLNKKQLIENTKMFGVMRSFGYSKKNIYLISLFRMLLIVLISFIYSFIIILIIYYTLKIVTKSYPFILGKLPIVISFNSLIIFIALVFLLIIVLNTLYIKKILKNSIMENIYE